MIINKAYKFRIYPNKTQATLIVIFYGNIIKFERY
ncbi:MAG: helix-turn-helix domain-containing protein [Bacillus cereus]|nr:helix-turn-helix domain-containing protein [Bacillus cereus]